METQIIGLQRIGLGNRRLTVTGLSSLTLDAKTWKNVFVGLAGLTITEMNEPDLMERNVHGFLGADFLRSYGAVIDFSTMTLWFPSERRR